MAAANTTTSNGPAIAVQQFIPSSNVCNLLKLPNELLVMILSYNVDDEEETKSLILTCHRLRDNLRPLLYVRNNYAKFWTAITHGDLETMKQCAEFNAAPVTITRPVQAMVPSSPPQTVLGRVLCTLSTVYWNKDCLQWVLERGADPTIPIVGSWSYKPLGPTHYNINTPIKILMHGYHHVGQYFRDSSANIIIGLIRMLMQHGATLPPSECLEWAMSWKSTTEALELVLEDLACKGKPFTDLIHHEAPSWSEWFASMAADSGDWACIHTLKLLQVKMEMLYEHGLLKERDHEPIRRSFALWKEVFGRRIELMHLPRYYRTKSREVTAGITAIWAEAE